jgi:HxlR-like helix-turn-helix
MRTRWQGGTVPSAKERRGSNLKGCPTEKASREARRHEDNTRIEDGSPDLHRQMDTQDFVFAEGAALSTRAVAPAPRECLQRMLTRTLRNLESTGLIARRVTRSKPIAVEYSLTQQGKTLIAPLKGMCRWSRRHGRQVSAEVRLKEA